MIPGVITRRRGLTLFAIVLGAWVLGSYSNSLQSADPQPISTQAKRFFETQVRPILVNHCQKCHGEKKQKNDLRLDSRPAVLTGGETGPAIVPGHPDKSLLIKAIRYGDPDLQMPPEKKLSPRHIDILTRWVKMGAPWVDGKTTQPSSNDLWWSLKPLERPKLPKVHLTGLVHWTRTPIDRFILAKLKQKGLKPSAEADKRTLLRRVTFDLIGLPPTPDEMASFLADRSPDAYEKVVERLLANPHHGERWARHWMDVVHYAETHGNDQDRPRPNAWPYRDYLISSLNQDKSYARFVQEQVAGDVLFPSDPLGIVATGFLATGPWDESSLLNIMEDTIDKKIARYLDRDDMITTTMSTFVSTTAHCARCHAHKFDPISQEDYYALQAVFAGIDKAERPFDPDSRTAQRRRHLLERKSKLLALGKKADPSLLAPAVQVQVAAWEKQVAASALKWVALDPATFTSSGGSTLTKLPDLSLLAGGKKPNVDTYTITAQTYLKGITGVRLEVLTHDSLPHKGPGRQDNGNLHLNEFRVKAGPRNTPAQIKLVPLQNPSADFNQDGWTIAMTLDGNPKTAWGIYPKVGIPHRAVFEFKEPLGFDGGTSLTFVLEQTHGGSHLIGRVRLSVTTSPRPFSATSDALPEAIANILAVPPLKRTQMQQANLALFVLGVQIDRQIATLPAQRMVYAAASDFKPDGNFRPAKTPRLIHVLRRGDVTKPLKEAKAGALAMIKGVPARFTLVNAKEEGPRRAALARWLTHHDNVLTWRSIVNRVWHYHFGRGIVDTPNDLGRMGGLPSHPELLDWLAVDFRQHGGSLKRLHKLIVTSAVYRQSCQHQTDHAAIDGDNRYLWRMNRLRLDAEVIHDAVLLATGNLNRTMGGPSVKNFHQKPGIHVTPALDYLGFDPDRPENYRRSVYRFVFRTLPDPFLEALDCPDSSQLAPTRNNSVSALQALAMLNNRFMVRQSEHLAQRAEKTAVHLPSRIHAIYSWTLNRLPTEMEIKAVTAYAVKHGLANACRVILNTNEFMFVN